MEDAVAELAVRRRKSDVRAVSSTPEGNATEKLLGDAGLAAEPADRADGSIIETEGEDCQEEVSLTEMIVAASDFELAEQSKAAGDLPAAIASYRRVLRSEPSHGWSHHCLAQSLWWSGDHIAAAEHYRSAATALPFVEQAVPLCQLAEMLALDDCLCGAWDSLRQAEERDSACTSWSDHARTQLALANAIAWAFDPIWYTGQSMYVGPQGAQEHDKLSVAMHYLDCGYRIGLRPHWILDQTHIEQQLEHAPSDAPAILRWLDALTRHEPVSPSWTVDLAWMANEQLRTGNQRTSPLAHCKTLSEQDYLTDEATSPLFDPEWYRMVSGVDDTVAPIYHYIETGAAQRRDPHPAFRSAYYADLSGLDADEDPVRHYLVKGGHQFFSPNPLLDLDYYFHRFPEIEKSSTPALIHFLAMEDRRGTIPRFDRNFYLAKNPDIASGSICPEKHFLEYGSREPHRRPFHGFSPAYMRSRHPAPLRYGLTDGGAYWAERDHRRHSVMVVSHSAGRTGAPLIALRIVEELSRIQSLDVTTVVFGEGPLVAEFARCSHVIRTQCPWGADVDENREIIRSLVQRQPVVAFCNSSESKHFSRDLRASGMRIVSLVHEIADHFDTPQSWGEIFEQSDRIVFPSRFVKERSDVRLGNLLSDECADPIVLPQGLLTRNFARFGVELARTRSRASLSIPDNDVLVLGCGAKDLRKGFDLFLQCAARLLTSSEGSGLHFLWLGGSEAASDNDDPIYWARKALDPVAARRLHFVANTADVEPFYQAADLFLLSSRSDPYPCVMHEALSAGLPIVYMEHSGGASELVGTRFGRAVPYENVSDMCETVLELSNDQGTRRQLGKAGAAHVGQECSFSDYVERLLRIASEIDPDETEAVYPSVHSTTVLCDLVVPSRREFMIYFLNPDWGISGINSLTESLIGKLNARGLTACLLLTRGRQTMLPRDLSLLPDVPMEYLDVDPDKPFPGNVHNALADYFGRHEPCVLVPNYDYVASEQTPRLPDHVGVVGVVHSDDCEHYEHVNRVGHYWNAIVGVSERVTQRVAELNPGYASRTVCIPNGVEPWRSIAELDEALQDLTGPVRLVYTGRLVHQQKRIERYVDLVNELERRGIDYVFEFVGAGEAEEWLRSALTSQVASKRVVLHGRCTREQTRQVVSRADVFTLFSDFEGMPISLLEALGAGCIPLVYAMDSGLNHFIDQGVDGYVCDSRTVDEAASVIAGLSDPDTRRRMRRASRKLLDSRKLTADAMADAYASVIQMSLRQSNAESFGRPRWIHLR